MRCRQKGFSLVELIIVIALMGILAMIGSFAWQRYVMNASLRTATRDVAADFFSAKEKAISENTNYTISFDLGNNNYTITGTTVLIKSPATFRSDITLQSTTLVGGLVTFMPRGTLGSGTGRVVLVNGRGSTGTVTVNITGKTYVTFNMQ